MRQRFQTKKNGISYVLAAFAGIGKYWCDGEKIEQKPLFKLA